MKPVDDLCAFMKDYAVEKTKTERSTQFLPQKKESGLDNKVAFLTSVENPELQQKGQSSSAKSEPYSIAYRRECFGEEDARLAIEEAQRRALLTERDRLVAERDELRDRVSKLKDAYEKSCFCRVCGEHRVRFALLPCTHFCICRMCSKKIESIKNCPLCGASVSGCMKVSLPSRSKVITTFK